MTTNDAEFSHGMHVVHDGPGQAPPLLLIHGSGASGAFWDPVVPARQSLITLSTTLSESQSHSRGAY